MRYFILIAICCCSVAVAAQKKSSKQIADFITERSIDSHIRFLAADEMRGRNTGSAELDIAANYIMTQFMASGVAPGDGKSFFQPVSLMRQSPPAKLQLTLDVGGTSGVFTGLLLEGSSASFTKPVVFAGYGTATELDKIDVKGKIVLCLFGTEGSTSLSDGIFRASPLKRKLVSERGAEALVELMTVPDATWSAMQGRLSGSRVMIQKDAIEIPHLLIKKTEADPLTALLGLGDGSGSLVVDKPQPTTVPAKNVVGIIRGTDPVLREEYVALTAHYDHVGVNKHAGQDSIFNGARDNAIGVTALLETAAYFTRNPPKRSILLIAFTAEEAGLLGSHWYSEHPVIPLKQTIFDLNCDGAGYNDKTIATIIDFNRTTADDRLKNACLAAGLVLKGDPAPEQGLFDRSDNVNFARKGVPSVNMSPGVKAFDNELMKYYHQPADEIESLDMSYLAKFYRAMLLSVYSLANDGARPVWKSGDKYEPAANALYTK